MASPTGSIRADVPLGFADRDWRECICRSLSSSHPNDIADAAPTIADTDADSGVVRFEEEADGRSRISVELGYTPRSRDGAEADVACAQQRLDRGLHKHRDFVLERFEQQPSGGIGATCPLENLLTATQGGVAHRMAS